MASSIIFLILFLTLGAALYSTGILDSIATGTNGMAPVQETTVAAVPASTAALVTITPESTHLTQSYVITEVTGDPDVTQNQVAGIRTITSTSSQSSSTATTGRQQSNGTRATGTLRLSQSSQSVTIPAGTKFSGGGVTVATSSTVSLSPGDSVTVDAYTLQTGPVGNIPAYAIDTSGNENGVTFYVQNPAPFSGGSNQQSDRFVQQSDIDGAAEALRGQVAEAAKSALSTQLQANEQFIGETHCVFRTRANPPAGFQASSVTITVQATCTAEVYDPQAALALAPKLLEQDLLQQFGANYILVGSIYATVTNTALADTAVSISIDAEAVAVFQFTDTQLRNIASLLSGQNQQSAQVFLRHKPGILTFTIQLTGGDEQTFPIDAHTITIKVEQITGL